MSEFLGTTPQPLPTAPDAKPAVQLSVRPARAEDVPLIFENIGY